MIPKFNSTKEVQEWLSKNERLVINTKKAVMKRADGIAYTLMLVDKDGETVKSGDVAKAEITPETKRIKVRSIINTTNLLDSHEDVHMKQLWNKSLKENTDNYLVKEHKFDFDNTITDNVHAFAKLYDWKELGAPYKGQTQALVFDSVIDKDEAPYMFAKYASGKVKQHSVGMRYVQLFLCINNKAYQEYFDNWEKYIDDVANKDDAEELGYFFAVTQAKVVEGSAVMKGSNWVTGTQSVEAAKNTSDEIDTEETHVTETETKFFNYNLF